MHRLTSHPERRQDSPPRRVSVTCVPVEEAALVETTVSPSAASGPALGLGARLALLAALLVVPVFFALLGTPQGHSYGFNLSWHVAFEAAQAQGALYPRHLPELGFGVGGLDFFFYGPLPFFLAAGPAAWL